MRSTQFIRSLALGFSLAALLAAPSALNARTGVIQDKDMYVEQVVTILRTHVSAMRWLIRHEIKYSDNLLRHATAIERVFGMLGPMEWHAAESFNYMRESDLPNKPSEIQFEELAENSNDAIRRVSKAAQRYARDHDKPRMLGSINAMIKSCGACHSILPKGTVPSVWKGMKE